MQKEKKRWLKPKEAAELLGIHPATVYEMASRGLFPCVHRPGLGLRIDRETLEKEMEREVKSRSRVGRKSKPEPQSEPEAK